MAADFGLTRRSVSSGLMAAAATTQLPGAAFAASAKPIRVGIVGLVAGTRGWAGRAHAGALKALPGFELRALATTKRESADEAARIFGVPLAFDNDAALFAEPTVDLIVVSVRVPGHHDIAMGALAAGKMVFCEWPLAANTDQAKDMAMLAQKKNLKSFVGLQSRALPAIRYIRDIIAAGQIGDVLSTSVIGSGSLWGETVTQENLYVMDRKSGASLLYIDAGHTIDAMCFVLGEFKSLSATMAQRRTRAIRTDTSESIPRDDEDQVAVSGILQSGAVASVHYRGGHIRGTQFLWEINGTKGDIVVTTDSEGLLQTGNVKVRAAFGADKALSDVVIPPAYELVSATGLNPSQMGVAEAYTLMARDIREGTKFIPDFHDGMMRHQTLDAIQKASDTGMRQTL